MQDGPEDAAQGAEVAGVGRVEATVADAHLDHVPSPEGQEALAGGWGSHGSQSSRSVRVRSAHGFAPPPSLGTLPAETIQERPDAHAPEQFFTNPSSMR